MPTTAGWWKALSRGNGARLITRDAAIFIIEAVTARVSGVERVNKIEIEFDDQQAKLRDVLTAIEELCGPTGWEALIAMGTIDHD
jgi:hypothetical protein